MNVWLLEFGRPATAATKIPHATNALAVKACCRPHLDRPGLLNVPRVVSEPVGQSVCSHRVQLLSGTSGADFKGGSCSPNESS